MKNIIVAGSLLLVTIGIINSCGGKSVGSLYGTYEGIDSYGNNISITLTSESDNEWRKFGMDNSSNLVYTDSRGCLQSTAQSIKWTWDLREGYVQTYYLGNKRTVIDIKGKKLYGSWGDYIDRRDGTPYKKY